MKKFTQETIDKRIQNTKNNRDQKEIEKQNAQGQERWNNACKTLGINPTQLFHLKEKE